jgi:DNA primase
MRYYGRNIDPIALWSKYVSFPPNIVLDLEREFLPLVYCPNPEHVNERSPAFQINVRKPYVHCFTQCGISGTYISAIALIESIGQNAARKLILRSSDLAGGGRSPSTNYTRNRRYVGTSKGGSIPSARRDDGRHFVGNFAASPQRARDYLAIRGITDPSIISRFQLGWDEETNRIVIPAFDHVGRLAFLIKRAITESDYPHYLYSEGAEKNALLYGAGQTDLGLVESQGLILVEGSTDVLRLHQHGLTNAVGLLGSSLSKRQAKLVAALRPRRVYTMTDKDVAGIKAIETITYRLRNLPILVCRYPRHVNDPAQFTAKEAHEAIDRAIPHMKFVKTTQR